MCTYTLPTRCRQFFFFGYYFKYISLKVINCSFSVSVKSIFPSSESEVFYLLLLLLHYIIMESDIVAFRIYNLYTTNLFTIVPDRTRRWKIYRSMDRIYNSIHGYAYGRFHVCREFSNRNRVVLLYVLYLKSIFKAICCNLAFSTSITCQMKSAVSNLRHLQLVAW